MAINSGFKGLKYILKILTTRLISEYDFKTAPSLFGLSMDFVSVFTLWLEEFRLDKVKVCLFLRRHYGGVEEEWS